MSTLLVAMSFTTAAHAVSVTVRSGNASIGLPDPAIRYLLEPSGLCGAQFSAPFTAPDFAAASAGPNPTVVPNYFVWNTSLACDPLAQWIGLDMAWTPRSMLLAQDFWVPDPCCIQHATLDFCFSVDDCLGDCDSFTNTGVFLNGTPLPIAGAGYATESHVIADVTSSLHCGLNTLYVYNRDVGCAVSGIMYSATFTIDECAVSVEPEAWGRVKSLYR